MGPFLPSALAVIMVAINTPSFVAAKPDDSKKKLAITRLEDVDQDFGFQGEYLGMVDKSLLQFVLFQVGDNAGNDFSNVGPG